MKEQASKRRREVEREVEITETDPIIDFLKKNGRILGSTGSSAGLERAMEVAQPLREDILECNAFVEGFSETAAAVDLGMIDLSTLENLDRIRFTITAMGDVRVLNVPNATLKASIRVYQEFQQTSFSVDGALDEMRDNSSADELELYNAQRTNIQNFLRKTLSLQEIHKKIPSFIKE